MKILYVHDRLGSLGGAEANVFITATELKMRGHEVNLLHGPGTGKGEESWRNLFGSCFEINESASIQEALERSSPDVIYVHKMARLDALEAVLSSGRPCVRMVHDHDIYCMRSYKYNYFTREICHKPAGPWCIFPCGAFIARGDGPGKLKWVSYLDKKREIALCRRFDRMLVVTAYMRDELIQNGFDREKIEIHPPIPRMGDPNIRSTFSDRNLILYAGQIIRGKGVDVLLEALALVKAKFECIILGDGGHREYCEQLARKLGLENRVRFKGFIPQEELKSYYRECSIIAISSVWPEPIATIGLEVMRYALPVVAFDAGGIKDWLRDGHNGFLVPWMDRAAYAARLDQLLADKAMARRMGLNGLELVSKEYDFEQYIAGLEQVFREVVRDRLTMRQRNVPASMEIAC